MAILKLLHVLFVFIWIGSLLTLTRLLAYQAKETTDTQLKIGKILKRMYFVNDLPSMILAVGFGLALLFLKDINFKAAWLHMKLTFAFLLIICDIICGCLITKHSRKPIKGRGIGYQIFHGITGLIFIGILITIYILKTTC